MKILRSKGQSYTQKSAAVGHEGGELGRGLKPFNSTGSSGEIDPSSLVNFIVSDPDLAMRQLVSALDKVVRKRPLRAFNVNAYVDRVKIAAYLWRLLKPHLPEEIRELGQTNKTWMSRVHSSYATDEIDEASPKTDKNAAIIEKYAEKANNDFKLGTAGARPAATRESLRGMWHDSLWRPSHEDTAQAIFDHVFTQEMLIRRAEKDPPDNFRSSKGKSNASGRGLAAARAESMAKSVHDPRVKKGEEPKKKRDWRDEHAEIYFKKLPLTPESSRKVDVAERIILALQDHVERNAANLGSIIGRAIFEHFGALKGTYERDDENVRHLVNLNNAVRTFYADLADTQRLRIAFDPKLRERHNQRKLTAKGDPGDAGDGFTRLLPADAGALREKMAAVDGNRDISRWIRLGRLVVHAADADDNSKFNQAEFERRLDYFATSAGQSQIKRNETFARVWRSAATMSLRTLKAWADPDNKAVKLAASEAQTDNRDIAAEEVSEIAIKNLNTHHFNAFNAVLFGDRLIKGQSRASLFTATEDSKDQAQRDMRAFLRLGSGMRNAISHLITKPRLARLLKVGIVSDAGHVPKHTAEKLKKLFTFDKNLRRYMIAQELDRLQIARFANETQVGNFIQQFSMLPLAEPVPVPRFMSVLARARALGDHVQKEVSKDRKGTQVRLNETIDDALRGLAKVQVDPETQAGQGPESCKLGLLRHLYDTGFRNWLARDGSGRTEVKAVLATLAKSKAQRVNAHKTEKRLHFTPDDSLVQTLLDEGYDSLPELFAELDARSAQLQRSFNRFKSDTKAQRQKSGWVDEFKQELFAHLFALYIQKAGFDWLYSLTARDSISSVKPIDPATISLPELPNQEWHERFHAWLYLLPLAEVSKLRHQMIKSRVLEIKGSDQPNEGEQKVLAEADMLMALHLSVRDAGYAGEEHKPLLDLLAKANPKTDFRTLVYGDVANFEKLMSTEKDDQNFSLAGTRRGLRDMLRVGNAAILSSIFKYHPLGPEEIGLFADKAQRDASGRAASLRDDLKKQLLDVYHQWTPKGTEAETQRNDALKTLAKHYQAAATDAAMKGFCSHAARLGDHLALHDLIMRISARLADYAWLWERDRAYVYLGMLWDNMGGRLEISVQPGTKSKAMTVSVTAPQNKSFALWNENGAFATDKSRAFDLKNLSPEHEDIFRDHFIGREEHPKDRARIKELMKAGTTFHVPRVSLGPVRIRNDFAHFNFLSFANPKDTKQDNNDDTINRTPNFTYLVNAARSLVSHDRKLKNAVAKSIAEIIEDEGLEITWTLGHERLRKARVAPRLMPHLEFLPRDLDDCRFALPRVSARYASMVKALFDHDHGGNRTREKTGKKDKDDKDIYAARGPLKYPAFPKESRVPPEIGSWSAYHGRDKA